MALAQRRKEVAFNQPSNGNRPLMESINAVEEIIRIPRAMQAPFEARSHVSGLQEFICNFDKVDDRMYLTGFLQLLTKMDRGNQIKCYLLLQRHGVLQYLEEFTQARSDDSYEPDYVDLWLLYRHVRTVRPRLILELGSGCSTVVMGTALLQNGQGRLCTVEPHAKWADSTNASLPRAIRASCTVNYSAGTVCDSGKQKSKRFADLPTDSPDMIYIDGAPKGAFWAGAENVAEIENELEPGTTIFIDSRFRALWFFLKGFARRKYRVRTQVVALADQVSREVVEARYGIDQFENSCVVLLE